MALIEAENISYFYEGNSDEKTAAVKGVSLKIEEGEFWGIIGQTGSGKSTLTELLSGLIKPDEGRVLIEGTDTKSAKNAVRALRGRVGLVFQYPENQLFEETVIKDVCFGPKNLGMSDDEALGAARWALKMVGLDEKYEECSPFELSGGQKRRCAIAGVLAMKPDVLILDEPTAGLDPEGRDVLLDMLREIKGECCKSVVLVSHSMEDVAKSAEKVLVMNGGEAQMQGGVREIYSHAEELRKIGLDVPQVTRLAEKLYKMGFALPREVLTVDEAADAVCEMLRGKICSET